MDYRDEFEKLLENTTVNSKLSPDEFNRRMLPIIQFIQKNVPGQLYKFRACTEDNLAAFDNDEIWLSKASKFNDLHDSLLYFDKPEILKQANKTFSADNFSDLFKFVKQSKKILENLSLQNPDIHTMITERLDTLDEKTFSGMCQQLLPNLDVFLDERFKELKEQIRNHIKMACLSGNVKSPLMWAHYADNSKGFALGYDFRGNQVSQCSNCHNRSCNNIKNAIIYPMVYSGRRFDATAYGKWYVGQYMLMCLGVAPETDYDDEFLFTKAALHKSNDWKYEDEWRIICSTPDSAVEKQDCYPIKKKPMAIYFGCRIPENDRKLLIQIADKKGLEKYQMYVDDYSFQYELKYRPL